MIFVFSSVSVYVDANIKKLVTHAGLAIELNIKCVICRTFYVYCRIYYPN